MKKLVKKITSILCSTVIAAASIVSTLSNNIKEANAYSNAMRFVSTAKALDYIQGRPNEATQHYGAPACDWCAMFVHLAACRCGLGDKVPMLSYCDNQYVTDSGEVINGFRSYYESLGQFLYRWEGQLPQIGDLIVFETSYPADGKADHIGIVIDINVATGLIYTIEGNTEGDVVGYKKYPYYDTSIIGYCQTMLDDTSAGTTVPTPPLTPSGPSVPDFDTECTKWEMTSLIGGWLREEPYGNKIGIISTGTVLTCDISKTQGEWLYMQSVPTESGIVSNGYVHCSNLTPYTGQSAIVTTTAAPQTTTTTTTTTVTSTAAETESTTSSVTATEPVEAAPTPVEPPQTSAAPTHFISSLIGANARTSAEINDNNIAVILDTDTKLYVDYYVNEFAHCIVEGTGAAYFVHHSTIAELPPTEDAYTVCARAGHYISSDIGANFRSYGDYNGEILCILNTWQEVSVLTYPNELGFVLVELTFGDGIVHNGYVHIDNISSY